MYGLATFAPSTCGVIKDGTGYRVTCGIQYGPINADFSLSAKVSSEAQTHGFKVDLHANRCEVGFDFHISSTGEVTVTKLGLVQLPKYGFKTEGSVPMAIRMLLSTVQTKLSEHFSKFMGQKIGTLKDDFAAMIKGTIASILS